MCTLATSYVIKALPCVAVCKRVRKTKERLFLGLTSAYPMEIVKYGLHINMGQLLVFGIQRCLHFGEL